MGKRCPSCSNTELSCSLGTGHQTSRYFEAGVTPLIKGALVRAACALGSCERGLPPQAHMLGCSTGGPRPEGPQVDVGLRGVLR